jgi:NAD-dependent SIR2 family protein deacetylase
MTQATLQQVAERVDAADALLIGAGAGMGVDSGLPDFRGDEGFWTAYPPFRRLGLSFVDLANPIWFKQDPAQAWGFYGHRRRLYLDTAPHRGFAILRQWAGNCPFGAFVFTSNVDGHFSAAGFDERQVVECHGSIHHLQCSRPCSPSIWQADLADDVTVDESTMRAAPPWPSCPSCEAVARPNILMFGDYAWIEQRTAAQMQRYRHWLASVRSKRLLIVEIGAGTAVPTVRWECERQGHQGQLIRINLRESETNGLGISVPLTGLQALEKIETLRQAR